MKWEGQEGSDNVEDRRGQGGGGGGGRMPMLGGRGIGIGTIVIALLAGWIFGINPLTVLSLLSGGGGGPAVQQSAPAGPAARPPADDKAAQFVSVVLRDTEQVWGRVFQASGSRYQEPKLVLFRGATPTACGTGQSAMGPFYCPGDAKVYIDLDFFDTLSRRLGAPGDFAQAYVIAHEVGHHLQTLLGVSEKVMQMRQRVSEADGNRLSVMQELQADCFAGVWGHHANRKSLLDAGDVEEGLRAAASIGDDVMQRRAQGRVSPESWTHGSSEQRVEWLRRGLSQGTIDACDTFGQGSR